MLLRVFHSVLFRSLTYVSARFERDSYSLQLEANRNGSLAATDTTTSYRSLHSVDNGRAPYVSSVSRARRKKPITGASFEPSLSGFSAIRSGSRPSPSPYRPGEGRRGSEL